MFDQSIPLTPDKFHEQIRGALQSLASMRVLGEQNYKVEWERVERAYDYLRLLDLPGAPIEPAKPASDLSIADIIGALEPIETFLGEYLTKRKVEAAELIEYRAGGVADGKLLNVAFISEVFGLDGSTLSRNVDRIDNPDGRGHVYRWESLCEYGNRRGRDIAAEHRKWQSTARKVCS